MITKTFKLTVATDNEKQMQKEEEYLSMVYGAEEIKEELCEDCISRPAAIDAVKELCLNYTPTKSVTHPHIDFVVEELERLPSAQPKKGRWIPIRERMPKDRQMVLFCDIENDIKIGYHIKGRPGTHFSQDGTFDDIKNVKAWMPLPAPCKEAEE